MFENELLWIPGTFLVQARNFIWSKLLHKFLIKITNHFNVVLSENEQNFISSSFMDYAARPLSINSPSTDISFFRVIDFSCKFTVVA